MDWLNENMQLRFMTAEASQDTPKANLFCAFHPEDQKIAQEVMQGILGLCNCTVFFYPRGGNARLENQVAAILDETALLVLLVSSHYLFSDSFAQDVICPYARSHRLPILPIMVETGLEEPFSQQLGNLQYLLFHGERHDSTAVPYREKLKNFLSQAVCTDISEDRFRNAFDSAVFLSYRKKDRQHAQSLMKMIHSDKRCQSIAIWYDEFLIPGEDFNRNISQELEDSALMILVVTPHVTEPDNYIIRTEYPAAVAIGKTILPFEMCRTLRAELEAYYPGLPDPIPGEQSHVVQDAILRAIKKTDSEPTSFDAEKDYLQGLAYLKGIRVEKNIEIAGQKILTAAQNQIAPAMQTLAFMYQNGEGVPISTQNAVKWQNRYIQVMSENGLSENAEQLVSAYFYLGELYEQDLQYPLALEAYLNISRLCETEELQNIAQFMELHATAVLKAGSLYMLQGDHFNARYRCFDTALRIRQQQQKLYPSTLQDVKVCEIYALLAQCCEECQNRSEAKSFTIELKKLLPSVAGIDNIQSDAYSLVDRILTCSNKLGHLLIKLFEDRSHEAFIWIGNSVLLAQKLVQISDCYSSRRQLILAHMNDGDQHADKKSENHLQAAKTAYDQAYAEATVVANNYGTPLELQRFFAQIQQKQAMVQFYLGNTDEAMISYEKAIAQFRQNYALFASAVLRKELYDCLLERCTVCEHQNIAHQQIMDILTEALALTKENVAASPLAVYQKDEAATHALLADIYKKQWDMDNAFAHTLSQLELLRNVLHGTGHIGDCRALAAALNKALPIAKLAGEFEAHRTLQAELSALIAKHGQFLS